MKVKVFFNGTNWTIADYSGELYYDILGTADEILLSYPRVRPTHFIGYVQRVKGFKQTDKTLQHKFLTNMKEQHTPISEGFNTAKFNDRLGLWLDDDTNLPVGMVQFLHLQGDKVTYDSVEDWNMVADKMNLTHVKAPNTVEPKRGLLNPVLKPGVFFKELFV